MTMTTTMTPSSTAKFRHPSVMMVLVLLLLHPTVAASSANWNHVPTRRDFDAWLKKHSESYSASRIRMTRSDGSHEHNSDNNDDSYNYYESRFAIFVQNAQTVQRHNRAFEKGFTLYKMTLEDSPFADLTGDEFQSLHLMEAQNCSATNHVSSGRVEDYVRKQQRRLAEEKDDTKNSVDWRTRGVVTPIKNQKHCGSCWTFSTTGTLEAHYCLELQRRRQRRTGSTSIHCPSWTGLSEQQLLDCAGDYDNHGCNGGLPSHAFEYIKYSPTGLALESTYPYLANSTDTVCKFESSDDDKSNNNNNNSPHHYSTVEVSEVFNITSLDENDLVQAVGAVGPVAIAYQVSPDFRFYSHGVYDSFNATTNGTNCQDDALSVNHAVVAVGYGQVPPTMEGKPGVPYYIVRNSWGTSFGMEGYFWMLRGQNLCGVSDCASFPIVPVLTKEESGVAASE